MKIFKYRYCYFCSYEEIIRVISTWNLKSENIILSILYIHIFKGLRDRKNQTRRRKKFNVSKTISLILQICKLFILYYINPKCNLNTNDIDRIWEVPVYYNIYLIGTIYYCNSCNHHWYYIVALLNKL